MYKVRKFSGLVECKISHIDLPVINTNGKSTVMVAISTISDNAESLDLLPYIGGINFTDSNGSPVFLNYNDVKIKTLNKMEPLRNNTHNKTWKVGIVSPNPSISVSFFIDTSAPDFPDDIKLYLHVKRFCVSSMLVAINQPKLIDYGGGRFRFVNKKIAANIFDGVVAIDFGNNSSVASVAVGNQELPELISIKRSSIVTLKLPVIHGDSQHKPIRLCVGPNYDDNHYSRSGIKTWTGDDDEKGLQKFSAESFSGAHKFPKRALANPDAQIDLKINNLNQLESSTLEIMKAFSEPTGVSETYLLPKRLPAELFLSDFLDRVAAIEIPGGLEFLGTPRYIVITYPTTYMRGEIIALRQSFARAYLRRLNVNPHSNKDFGVFDPKNLDHKLVNHITQSNIGTISDIHDMDDVFIKNLEDARKDLTYNNYFFNAQNGNSKSVISAMIDEASAAAYYFIRKYVISGFGVEGFRVLHPEGCRIVVVDCGAGTTDVAAFDLIAVNNDSIKSSLDVSLAKLTGDHAFCGDFVTMQIARLIKAKMYYFSKNPHINLNNLGFNVTFPILNYDSQVDGGSICKFVDLLVGKWDLNQVPNPKSFPWFQDIAGIDTKLYDGPNDIKENLLRNLIHEADRIKIGISEKFNLINNNPSEKLSSSFLRIVSNANSLNKLDHFPDICIYYSEINELIKVDLERLVYTVNHAMIIPSGTEEDSKIISQVLLTGKGSIYPKIIDTFREGLSLIKPDTQVKSLADIARVNNSQTDTISELKNCVSMGACWWFSDSRLGLAPLIRFRNQLENLLPFDLQVSDPNTNQLVTVFKVKTQYSDIEKPELFDFPNSVINCHTSITKVTLYRRFPGKSGEAYTLFTWTNSSNKFYVSWDKNENDFVIRDANNKEGIKSRAPSSYDYFVSPLWSGKL